MTRTTPAGESWSAWLIPRMAVHSWRQSDLVTAVNDAGYDLARQTVSKWLKSENAADPNMAVAVAEVLGQSPADALRAAGYSVVADAMGGTLRVAGTPPEPLDEGIRRVLAREDLTPERQARIIESYRRRAALLLADLDEAIADAVESRRDPNGESRTG